MTTQSPFLKLTCSPTETIREDGIYQRKHRIQVHLDASAGSGQYDGRIAVRYRQRGNDAELSTFANWTVRALYTIDPPQCFFGEIDPSKPTQKAIVITMSHQTKTPFAVRSIHVPKGVIVKAPPADLAIAEQQLSLSLDTSKIQDHLWGEVVIETTMTDQPTVRIPVAVVVKQTLTSGKDQR